MRSSDDCRSLSGESGSLPGAFMSSRPKSLMPSDSRMRLLIRACASCSASLTDSGLLRLRLAMTINGQALAPVIVQHLVSLSWGTTPLISDPVSVTKPIESRSPKERVLEAILECGASAVPARGLASRTRAASGITLTGTTTGPGGAFPGLGQAGAGNAHLGTQGLRPPVGAGLRDRTSRHVPYVDGPLLARVGSVRIEAIALICPVCCRGHT